MVDMVDIIYSVYCEYKAPSPVSCCHTLSSSMLPVAGLAVASTPCMLGSKYRA